MFQKLITVVTKTSYFVDMVSFMWIFFERGQTCHLDILHCVELLCLVTISNHVQLTDTVLLIKAAIKIGVISLHFVKISSILLITQRRQATKNQSNFLHKLRITF